MNIGNDITRFYVLVKHPPTADGVIASVEADSTEGAVQQFQVILGRLLVSSPSDAGVGVGGGFTDGSNIYRIYHGAAGMEALASLCQAVGLFNPPEAEAVPKFRMGQIMSTPAALQALRDAGAGAFRYLYRHQCGDFGELDPQDVVMQNAALRHEGNPAEQQRMVSKYVLRQTGVVIWIITEADRRSTTILLPDEC
jgi:hypothetical protein